MAVYWVNLGFTDLRKAEFEIQTKYIPTSPQRLTSSPALDIHEYLAHPEITKIIVNGSSNTTPLMQSLLKRKQQKTEPNYQEDSLISNE